MHSSENYPEPTNLCHCRQVQHIYFHHLNLCQNGLTFFTAEATFMKGTRTQKCVKKNVKPSHGGIHWIALAENSQMSTHLPRFHFSGFWHHFILAKLATSRIRLNLFLSFILIKYNSFKLTNSTKGQHNGLANWFSYCLFLDYPINTHSRQKQLDNLGEIFLKAKAHLIKKIFEGEMFIRMLQPTLLQIKKKKILYFRVTDKSIKDPDDNFKSNS